MRNLILTICFTLAVVISHAQINPGDLTGAWQWNGSDESGNPVTAVVIFAEGGYQVATWYNLESKKFIHTNGGLWSLEGNTITETVEFHTDDAEKVGTSVSFQITLDGDVLKIVGDEQPWSRIDSGGPGKLAGAWLITGRERNGQMTLIKPGPRKTMKILSGTRFQWIAYNVDTKQFMGTGGGTYTTADGRYTENIEFFSRDSSRVGASLGFDFELKEGAWHHKGNSSKGAPIYEIWNLRQKVEAK